jgi:pseudouridylate synthase / pseudouridine kinase
VQILVAQWQLNMSNGVLFGVPIPEQYEDIGATLQEAVEQAVAESEANGVSRQGKDVTPWLLKRIEELTDGKSLTSSRSNLKY